MARIDANRLELTERVVQINRVSKVVKGGRRFSFSAIVVVGDGRGHVGAGLGKADEVPEAIKKGVEDAKKHLMLVPLVDHTIPHPVTADFGAAKVLDRKSTRLNSSHMSISYAVFCLKKKSKRIQTYSMCWHQ